MRLDLQRFAANVAGLSVLLALAACQKSEKVPTTAERLKNVEVRQETEPDSYLPRKSVDYLESLKNLKDTSEKPAAAAEPAPPAKTIAPVVAKAAERQPEALAITAEARPIVPSPAPALAPASAPAIAPAAVQEPANKVEPAKVDTAAASQSAYVANLRGYLERVKRYPSSREARQQRPAGIVHVWLELTRDGKFKDAGIEQTSNSQILDQAALSTVRQGNYGAFPADAWPGQPFQRFTFGLAYSLAE